MSSDSKKKSTFRRGHVVSPEPASDQSTIQNVFEFLHDYVPQAVGVGKDEYRERVLWACFETGDINDVTMEHHVHGRELPLLLTLGLASGFSLWQVSPGGDARELFCSHDDGDPVRIVRLLKTPENCTGVNPDNFVDQRPILAVVKKGRHSTSGSTVAYSTLQLISLRSVGDSIVKKFSFKSRAIVDIKCSRRVVCVVFQKRIVVLDAGSLENKFVVRNNFPVNTYPCNPVAMGTRWMAFPETKLSSKHQSLGGVSSCSASSVATTVLKNVKKGISALSETISGLTGKGYQSSVSASVESLETQHHSPSPESVQANIVTIIDVCSDYPQEFKVQDLERRSGVIAHFVAHQGLIAALEFNMSGTLLLTASNEGHSFHIFHILPHPYFSAESAVHHLYTLYRGATSGVVQNVCFSMDSRWVSVSTLNGTSHVFPISPYGGSVTVRTHTSPRVVNKLSRFHTSAGMETVPSHSHSNKSIPGTGQSPPSDSRDFPSVTPVSPNSRNLPLPFPVSVSALQLIKQPYLSPVETSGRSSVTGGGGVSSRVDNGEPFITLAGPDVTCVRTLFSQTHNSTWSRAGVSEQGAMYSLFVVGSSGVLVEHQLEPVKQSAASDGEDAPIELLRHSKQCWRLNPPSFQTGSIVLPLSEENPLISANNDYQKFCLKSRESCSPLLAEPSTDSEWLSQVEILTYAPPTRRLWMGPQFSFKTYQDTPPIFASSTSKATALTTPSPPNTIITSESPCGHSNKRPPDETAVLFPSQESLLLDLLSEPLELNTVLLKSIDTSPPAVQEGVGSGTASMETGVLEVFGSWNKVAPHLESAVFESEVERQLEDAMNEQSVTVVASSSVARTGFTLPRDSS